MFQTPHFSEYAFITMMPPGHTKSRPLGIVGCALLFAMVVGTVAGGSDSPVCAADVPAGDNVAVELAAAAQGVERIVAHRGAMLDRPENTVAAIERAIEAGATAVEVDVRTSRDGTLVLMHDARVDRTTNGTGRVNALSWAELAALDAGTWFRPEYATERVPSLDQILKVCRGRIDVQLDLKEDGAAYADRIAASVATHGEPTRTMVAVRNVKQARQVKKRLPEARILSFLHDRRKLDSFLAAEVDFLRPQISWIEKNPALLTKIRDGGAKIHFDATTGTSEKVIPLLKYRPESLLCDDPAQLVKTLTQLRKKHSE